MIRVGEYLLFSLWSETEFEEEVGPINRGPGVAPLTLAHNVGSKAQVDEVLRTARGAGADPVAVTEGPEDGGPPPPAWVAVDREWGGYSGFFGDPDGYRWEIACAPGQVNDIVVPGT